MDKDPNNLPAGPPANEPLGPSEAVFLLRADGTIVWSSEEAATWWRTSGSALAGSPFAGLFYLEPPGSAPSLTRSPWSVLETAASTRPLTLQAQVEGGGFEARVRLSFLEAAAGEVCHLARVRRPEAQPAAAASALSMAPETAAKPPFAPPAKPPGPKLKLESHPAAPESPVAAAPAPVPSRAEASAMAIPDSADREGAGHNLAPVGEDGGASRARPAGLVEGAPTLLPWSLLERGQVGLFHLDLAAGTARFSDSWKDLLGLGAGEGLDQPQAFADLIHPEDSEAAPQAQRRGPAGGTVDFSAELRLLTAGGGWRWMQLAGLRRYDEDGGLAAVTGVMLDAEEQHELEDESFRNEERFQRLTGRGRAGFFELDFVADTAWFSPTFRHALGARAEEIGETAQDFAHFLPEDEAAAGVEAFFESLTAQPPAGLATHYRLRHSDGRLLPVEAFLAVERDRRGRMVRVSGLQILASEPEVEADSGARADSAAHEALAGLDAVGEAVVLIDRRGRIVHANARAAHMVKVAAETLQWEPVEERFVLVERATSAPAPGLVQRVLAGETALELDHAYALAVGNERIELVVTCRPLLDAAGRPAGAVLVLRAPAEMPLSPAELISSNRMESIGRLACGIAHDFNNLLTTVTGGVSLALDKHDFAPLDLALKACTNARNLARQLLTFARGDTSGKKVAAINDVIRETARMASAGSSVAIELELNDDVHPVLLDTAQFVQVFTNLILNALQAMPSGGRIWLRTVNTPLGQVNSVSLPAGEYVRIDVQDNGPGIAPENLEHIFEPFFTTRADGTGLGLPMVRSIVTRHDGAIEVASTVGSGTTFTIYLPRAYNETVTDAPRPLSVAYGTGRVLLMDDDPDLCMIAQGMLEMLGYEAETAATATDAISLFRRNHELGRTYSAVVLDLTMAGGLGGEEVLSRLKEIDPGVVAIVSSGYATEDNADRYHKLGFAGVLSKPYRSADLGRVLKQVLKAPA